MYADRRRYEARLKRLPFRKITGCGSAKTSGDFLWVVERDISEIAIDEYNRISAIGETYGAANDDIYICYMDQNANIIEEYAFGKSFPGGGGIAVGQDNVVYVTGTYKGTVDFGTDNSGTITKTNRGGSDVFMGRLSLGMPTISGVVFFYPSHVMMASVDIAAAGLAGTSTNSTGFYHLDVPYGWSGSVSLSCPGYTFANSPRTYTNVVSDITTQDYWVMSDPVVHVSGRVTDQGGSGVPGVTIDFSNGGGGTTTNSSGYYDQILDYKWTGAATPSMTGGSFTPTHLNYGVLTACQYNQDFVMQSTAVQNEDGGPAVYMLEKGYPNPFNPSVTFPYTVPERGEVSIDILAVNGRKVRTLLSGMHPAGAAQVIWSGDDDAGQRVSSGIYFCRLQAADHVLIQKVVFTK